MQEESNKGEVADVLAEMFRDKEKDRLLKEREEIIQQNNAALKEKDGELKGKGRGAGGPTGRTQEATGTSRQNEVAPYSLPHPLGSLEAGPPPPRAAPMPSGITLSRTPGRLSRPFRLSRVP